MDNPAHTLATFYLSIFPPSTTEPRATPHSRYTPSHRNLLQFSPAHYRKE